MDICTTQFGPWGLFNPAFQEDIIEPKAKILHSALWKSGMGFAQIRINCHTMDIKKWIELSSVLQCLLLT